MQVIRSEQTLFLRLKKKVYKKFRYKSARKLGWEFEKTIKMTEKKLFEKMVVSLFQVKLIVFF